jgi:hypothetical protein
MGMDQMYRVQIREENSSCLRIVAPFIEHALTETNARPIVGESFIGKMEALKDPEEASIYQESEVVKLKPDVSIQDQNYRIALSSPPNGRNIVQIQD